MTHKSRLPEIREALAIATAEARQAGAGAARGSAALRDSATGAMSPREALQSALVRMHAAIAALRQSSATARPAPSAPPAAALAESTRCIRCGGPRLARDDQGIVCLTCHARYAR